MKKKLNPANSNVYKMSVILSNHQNANVQKATTKSKVSALFAKHRSSSILKVLPASQSAHHKRINSSLMGNVSVSGLMLRKMEDVSHALRTAFSMKDSSSANATLTFI